MAYPIYYRGKYGVFMDCDFVWSINDSSMFPAHHFYIAERATSIRSASRKGDL